MSLLRKLLISFDYIRNFLFRNLGFIVFGLLLFGNFVLLIVNYFEMNLFEGLMLVIGWNQAFITGFLSYKIYEVSERDSKLPKLGLNLVDVTDIESPYEDHQVRRCTVELVNQSQGRAKIKDVDLDVSWNEQELKKRNPAEGCISVGFPSGGKQIPFNLDNGEKEEIIFQINGYSFLKGLSIEIHETILGKLEYPLMLSEITNLMLLKSGEDKKNN